MRALTTEFVERHIVTPDLHSAFTETISSAMRLRNSIPAEILMFVLVVVAGPWIWRETAALRSDTWYAAATPAGMAYTSAGFWYGYVSVPVFQFILLRWYYRIFIWCRFLFHLSRLDLNLVPIHPDRCCGLGFLANVAFAFAPLLMAHSSVVAGFVANRILHEQATLPEYRFELVAMAAFLFIIALGPLCVFTPKLNRARLSGLRTYGRLASDYVSDFAKKWGPGAKSVVDPLLGSADIQSLADLDNSFSIVKEIRMAPFGKETIVRFLVVIMLPLVPLAFTMFSPEDLLRRLLAVIL
jgi:hypothetical protein